MDDGSTFFLISLFLCGDLAMVGLDLGSADMGINNFDVCLVFAWWLMFPFSSLYFGVEILQWWECGTGFGFG